jgi:hypothetical protein
LRAAAVVGGLYLAFGASVLTAMTQTPERFGLFMRHMPMPLVWGALPAQRMWLWARRGTLAPGTMAPEFTLQKQDRSGRITLSAFRGHKPVVLVFGSYS